MSSKIEKWKEWVEVVCHNCGNLLLSQDMFLDIQNMIAKNPPMQQNDYFYEYLKDTYVAHVLMMLSKHIKRGDKSISLVNLAEDIINNPQELTQPHVAKQVQQKLNRFRESAEAFEQYADRTIAHNDKRPPVRIPTYKQIHNAIDAMDSLSIQCSLAVGGDYVDTCKPTVQYGWLQVFRKMGIKI